MSSAFLAHRAPQFAVYNATVDAAFDALVAACNELEAQMSGAPRAEFLAAIKPLEAQYFAVERAARLEFFRAGLASPPTGARA